MLSLTRMVNESIMLYTTDGPIEVVVTKVDGKQVRIGIAAPQAVEIVRSEIDDRKNTIAKAS
jgi:carbon storage regulator CsrA